MRDRRTIPVALLLLAVALLSGVGPVASEDAPRWLSPEQREALERSPVIEPGVVDQLGLHGAVRVVVQIEVQDPATALPRTRFDDVAARAELAGESDRIAAAAGAHFVVTHRLRSLPALTGAADAEGLAALAVQPGVRSVGLDLPQSASLAESLPLIGVPPLQAEGLQGAGVTVAIVDTGVDFKHRALKKARRDEHCFCSDAAGGCCPNGLEEQGGRKSASDDNGHGTHVAGIVASRGKAGAPKGVAPRAKLVAVRVLGPTGTGFSSGTLAALDWLLTEHADVDVVNLSLGSNQLFKGACDNKAGTAGTLYAMAVSGLRERGTLVVAASGNDGSRKKMGLPACLRDATSVGAGFDGPFFSIDAGFCSQTDIGPDDVACFSNRPKNLDLVAPGVLITSTALHRGSADKAGTSQASPHVAGCAALLLGAHPEASPADVEGAMIDGGVTVRDNKGRRFPRLDCEAAASLLEPTP